MMNDLLKIWRGVSASTLLVLLSACGSTQDTGIRSGSSTYYADAAVPRAVPITREQLSQGDSGQRITPAYATPSFMRDVEPTSAFLASGPDIFAQSYLLLDARTGRHLAGQNAELPRPVASTQKLVTALVVLDAGNLDKLVRVSASDVAVEPTRLGLRPGEVYSRRTLLYAFLIKSANDVANVLARDNAGSISAFDGQRGYFQWPPVVDSEFTDTHWHHHRADRVLGCVPVLVRSDRCEVDPVQQHRRAVFPYRTAHLRRIFPFAAVASLAGETIGCFHRSEREGSPPNV